MAEIKIRRVDVTVLSIDPCKIDVKWVLEPTVLPLRDYKLIIERSENKSSGYCHVSTVSGTTARFLDLAVELHNMNREYSYRVSAQNIRTDKIVSVMIGEWNGYPDLKSLEMIRLLNFLLDDRTGTPAFVFSQISDGYRCPICWDQATSRVIDPDCTTCLGTGKIGGYYDPILSMIDFSPDAKNVEHAGWGEIQPNQVDGLLSSYPEIKPRDVIIRANDDIAFIVERWNGVKEPGSTTVLHQMIRLTTMTRSDIESKLIVPENLRLQAVDRLRYRKELREW